MSRPPVPVASALDAIGNTPVVRLRHVVPEGCADVYLKLEFYNPTASYKDRMAKSMIEGAEQSGALKHGMTVIEASGGSTGSSLAFVCAVKGYKFRVVTSNAFAQEKLRTIQSFGAELDIVHSPSGSITKDLIPSMIARAKEAGRSKDFLWTDQFNNRDALIGYSQIGHELTHQFPDGIDGFCGAVGVAGMLIGVAQVLKPRWPNVKVVVLEPASSPVITTGKPGQHRVEGVGIGFVPPLLDKQLYDEAWAIEESEGRKMCRQLAKLEGLLVGTSTGLNVVAAIKLARQLGPGKTVVTVASDSGLKYLSGDLFAEEETLKSHI